MDVVVVVTVAAVVAVAGVDKNLFVLPSPIPNDPVVKGVTSSGCPAEIVVRGVCGVNDTSPEMS